MAPCSLSGALTPWDPTLTWKDIIYNHLKAEIFTAAAKLKVLACNLDG